MDMDNNDQWQLMDDEQLCGWFLLAVIQERWDDARELASLCVERGLISQDHARLVDARMKPVNE